MIKKEVQPQSTSHKIMILHGYADDEIMRIMNTVKALYEDRSALIFAKSTSRSLTMRLSELIENLQSDHEHLRKNPPSRSPRPNA